jgi:hypothetical protein
MISFTIRKICLPAFWALAVAFFVVYAPEKSWAGYTDLPHQFEEMVANEESYSSGIQGYLINNGVYGKQYSGFKFFIPPGTIRIRFYFTATAIVHYGPAIYAASRFNYPPEATRRDFIDQEDDLFNLVDQKKAARMTDLQTIKGYMGKRTNLIGEQVWIHSEYNTEEILPAEFRDKGGWVYVNLFNKNKGDSVPINTIQGSFEVISEKYNAWREEMNFPSPDPDDPAEPEFGFSIPSQTNAELDKDYTANVSFKNFTEAREISISGGGGQYKIDGGDYTADPGRVAPGQSVTVKLRSSSNYSRTVKTTLTLGERSSEFQVTTKPDPDSVNQTIIFNPNHVAGVNKNIWVESSQIDVVVSASISISGGGEYKINNSSYTSKAATVKPGDKIRVRLKSSSEDHTTVRTTLTIGSASGVFMVTTAVGSGGGGNSGPLPDLCALWPDLPGCGGNPEPNPPDLEPQIHVEISVQPKGFNHQEVPSGDRGGPELLEVNIELPSNWPGSDGNGDGYMFAGLEIPDLGFFMAHLDIFGNVRLFRYNEGDPLVPYGLAILNGHNIIEANPFLSLQEWGFTAEDFARIGAVFYMVIVPDGDWDNWVGGSFSFKGDDSVLSSLEPTSFMPTIPGDPGDNLDETDDGDHSLKDPLVVKAGYLEFSPNIFEVSGSGHQPFQLDLRLPHGWENMLENRLEGTDPDEIDWSVFAMILVDGSIDQQFLARADILGKSRLIIFEDYTPLRPATWSRDLSSGSAVISLFPDVDDLGLSAGEIARLDLRMYVALVPQGDWTNFFGILFYFEE